MHTQYIRRQTTNTPSQSTKWYFNTACTYGFAPGTSCLTKSWVTNTIHSMNMLHPNLCVSFQLLSLTTINTANNITIRITTLRNSEPDTTSMLSVSLPMVSANSSHGSGSPIKMSKILLPMDELTAISPMPIFATITELNKSGTDVPAAKKVSPITSSGTPHASPMRMA